MKMKGNGGNRVMRQVRKKDPMPFTLITRKGRVMRFYLKEVAELYRIFEGGVIVTEDVPGVSEYKVIASP